jgi:ankyrin repeat protein
LSILDEPINKEASVMKVKISLSILILFFTLLIMTTSCATTPKLIKMTERGDYEKIEKKIDKGANVNVKDDMGRTPLMFASLEGNAEIVRLLIEEGADVNAMTGRVFFASSGSDSAEATFISAISLMMARDLNNRTALMYAAEQGHAEIVRLLIEAGANVNTIGWQNRTALIYASECGDVECVQSLIDAGADVNVVTNGGETACTIASREGHSQVVALLKEAGAKQ